MNKFMRIAVSAAVVALLPGCGAKGPLILPEKVVPIEAPTETAPATTPETVPSVDGMDTDAVPSEAQAEDAVETPLQPAKDD